MVQSIEEAARLVQSPDVVPMARLGPDDSGTGVHDFSLLSRLLQDSGEAMNMELCDVLFHCHSIAFKEASGGDRT